MTLVWADCSQLRPPRQAAPQTKSNEVRLARQKQVEKGDAATTQLVATWRERAEDMVWALVNSPEYVWIP